MNTRVSVDACGYLCVVTMVIVDNVVLKKGVSVYCPFDHVTVVKHFSDGRPAKKEVKEIVCKNISQ